MAVIGIMDWDYMHYEHVIPNLECAKLCTYFHNHHDVATLVSKMEPARYTQFFVRKEYDDGIYPKSLFLPNCIYGGRAFTPQHYSPLDPDIEKTIPNMHLYDKFKGLFGKPTQDQQMIKHILNCAHIRLSTDEQKPKTMNQLERILACGRHTGIIFHDYDLARIPGAYDIIYDLSRTRTFKTKEGINPYAVGNKFPIQVTSSEELQKWLKIVSMPNLFCLQYNGVMDNETLYNLCTENKRMARQFYYKVDYDCSDEDQFFMERLPKIFEQVLFLRRHNTRTLLKYSQEKIMTPELRDFLDLLNYWLRFTFDEGYRKGAYTLYNFCRLNKKKAYKEWAFRWMDVTPDQMRNSFQYIRERNYELFKKFYEWDFVVYKDGGFENEWKRDQRENHSE